jgi:hypothetical protein
MAKDPADRPEDGAAVASALQSSVDATSTERILSPAAWRGDTAVLPVAETTGPPKSRRPLLWIGLAALLIAGLIAFFVVRSTGQGTVTVPKLVGKTRANAGAAARMVGLNPRFEGDPSGRVIDQRPAPGSEVLEGKSVFLTLAPVQAASPSPFPTPEEPKEHGKGKGKGHDEEHRKGND